MTATIPGIGIQCVKKKDMADSVKIRKQIGIDPFKKGFDDIMNDANVNLNAIRLAFQVSTLCLVILHTALRQFRFEEDLTENHSSYIK